ncbi:MAG: Flp pilus assembly protein CpaB [Acidobacteria bacterium]|nr:Flp pilus assembly protein CpaB [Acidobacteriota bacterium]
MNQNRMVVGLAIALVVAFVLSTFVYKQFQKASAVKPVDTEHVVVAAKAMELGTRVDAGNLKLIAWPAGQSVVGMFTSIDQAANRALITPVAANEMILDSKLAPKEAGAGLPAAIPEGMRAMSVAVNDVIGVAGFVTPGTVVDVLVTGKLVGANHGDEDTITRTILEDIRVLAAGQKIEQDREGKPQTVPVITLLVTPEDAARLAMASTQGKIQLALRNTIDTKRVEPASVLEANLFSGVSAKSAPAPKHVAVKEAAPAPPSPYTIEVITGNKRESKSFPNQ